MSPFIPLPPLRPQVIKTRAKSRFDPFILYPLKTRAKSRFDPFILLQECIFLGNLDARRDWGHAKDFVEIAGRELDIEIHWQGNGIEEIGMDSRTSRIVVRIDPRYFRPTEVESLLGDAGKAFKKLGWTPRISFEKMVREMVAHDLREVERDALCRREGFEIPNHCEI